MKKLLYPLIASALITIVPFLLTFEKGQDIIRGLFGFEYFAILLFIVFFKRVRGVLILLVALLLTIAWLDLQNLLAIKNWSTGCYGLIPFVTCGLAVAIVWQIKPFKFNAICFILFIALILHLEANNQYVAQPLAQFPTIDYLERSAPKPVQRTKIAEYYKNKYIVTDSVTITRDYIDSTRNNVIILVESWGLPIDIRRFENQLEFFNGTATAIGIHNRMYSRTRTAEREDLIKTISRDSTGHKDTTFLPQIYATNGHSTTFLFSGDSLEQFRFKYIHNIGFEHTIYGNGLDDSAMISKIDSILTEPAPMHCIAWTTRNTKFPMPEFASIYNSSADAVDSAYTKRLTHTLSSIANLARKHPEARFIIQGDHNPILSPIKFQERFYKRWVPFIVLN